jgi:hypothetical protein
MSSLSDETNEQEERAIGLLNREFDLLDTNCRVELNKARIAAGTDCELLELLKELGAALAAIRGVVREIHVIRTADHPFGMRMKTANSKMQLLWSVTEGFPVKLCRARLAKKNAQHLIPQHEKAVTLGNWSATSCSELVYKVARGHHDLLDRHSSNKVRLWGPFTAEAEGKGDGSLRKRRYKIDQAGFKKLDETLSRKHGLDFLAQAAQEDQPNERQETARQLAEVDTPSEDRWIRIIEAERMSDINRGTISRAANNGEILDNGLRDRGRRIDVVSFWRWHDEYRKRTTGSDS